MSLKLTTENFESEVLNSDKISLIDMWAPWCGPCLVVGPIINEVAEEYKDKAVVGKINIDEQGDLALKYGIRSIPTMLIIKDGEVVDKLVGAVPKNQITETLDKHLN